MTYKIEIKKHRGNDERGYASWEDVYDQSVEDLDVPGVIAVINNLTKKRTRRRAGKIKPLEVHPVGNPNIKQ